MARSTMDRIDGALRTMELHELAELYCLALEKENGATERIPHLFYRVIRKHIALTVRLRLESEDDDG